MAPHATRLTLNTLLHLLAVHLRQATRTHIDITWIDP